MLIQPFDAPIGADVLDLHLAEISDIEFEQIHDAWLKWGVLRFRNQQLTDETLKTFSSRFGELEYAPHGRVSQEELAKIPNPFVATISNIVENGKPIGGLSNLETSWHTDMSYIEQPPTASLLYAVEVPRYGGETSFCCMRTAFADLPNELRKRCANLQIKHDAAHDSIGKLRRGHDPFDSAKDAPGVYHPALIAHPETHESALFLGRRQFAYIDGLTVDESEALLDAIWKHVAQAHQCWTQRWKRGDLVVWDNRVVMHRRASFPNVERRLMRRTQVRATARPTPALAR
ncbi:MAG: TauD/TfdA family dioxygenase [Gammaproteobacteria bacterium]|nr:TauD/TfdA family dioxygenase [Gammaproteobacteria bacterium]